MLCLNIRQSFGHFHSAGFSIAWEAITKRGKMKYFSLLWMLSSALLIATISVDASQAYHSDQGGVRTAVYKSPEFILGPGSVNNKVYLNIDFPRGHIALKDFVAEVVDEMGNSIPLDETYLHHWLIMRYYHPTSSSDGNQTEIAYVRNSGLCQDITLGQYFGLGAETRGTLTHLPDPYGIEVGNPATIPDGYEERWYVNVHAIDTRGVVDRMGCAECRCDLYNVTKDSQGGPLPKGYIGGLRCCYDETQCKLRGGVADVRRKLYLRYTVKWVEWDDSILPVRIYVLDVTDNRLSSKSNRGNASLGCQVEYDVKQCGASRKNKGQCIDKKKAGMIMPRGGNLIYGVGHQHWGGSGITLHGQDGRVLCTSVPIYGNGKAAGNENDYVVGMSSCYPEPGSVTIADGELLTVVSDYSSTQVHTGLMGLFYLLVH